MGRLNAVKCAEPNVACGAVRIVLSFEIILTQQWLVYTIGPGFPSENENSFL